MSYYYNHQNNPYYVRSSFSTRSTRSDSSGRISMTDIDFDNDVRNSKQEFIKTSKKVANILFI